MEAKNFFHYIFSSFAYDFILFISPKNKIKEIESRLNLVQGFYFLSCYYYYYYFNMRRKPYEVDAKMLQFFSLV